MFTETFIPHANGVTTSILNARRGLTGKGHKVTVYSAGPPMLENESVHYYGGKIFPLYPDFPIAIYPTRYGRRNKRALNRQNADLIHIHAPGPVGLRGYWAAKRKGLPFVLTYHTIIEPLVRYAPFGWKTFYRVGSQAADRAMSRRCTLLIAPTKEMRRHLIQKYPAFEEKIRVVPTGIDVHRYRPGLDASSLRQAWGFAARERIILYLGRLSYEKRIDVVLRAFARLRAQGPDLRLVIAGTGPAMDELKSMAKSLQLDGVVRFAGHVRDQDVPLAYSAADVFASASEIETQGLTLLEAMACAKPAAVAAIGGFLDVVRDGENAYLFAPGSVDGATHALRLALGVPARVREAARETALEFSIERCTQLLESAYDEALRQDAPSG